MKKFLIILILLPLYGCEDPETGRDVFGNLTWTSASKPIQIGENKYYTETYVKEIGIDRAKSFCSSSGKTSEVMQMDTTDRGLTTITFSCI